jgi:hypothetical protein
MLKKNKIEHERLRIFGHSVQTPTWRNREQKSVEAEKLQLSSKERREA